MTTPVTGDAARLRHFSEIAQLVARGGDIGGLVQAVTDSATAWSGGRFGAFFYNVTNEAGELYSLYKVSGAPIEAFSCFDMPRKTALFAPTFAGEGVIRSEDIRLDPRYGSMAPHQGMPPGHLPVVSYLATPVISSSGRVHGALLIAHDEPGVFTEESEKIVTAVAVHAAIAIDNAQLFEETRRSQESAARLAAIVESSEDAIVAKSLDGIIESWNAGAERLFGYTAEEAVGQPITILIPDERLHEEATILARLRTGARTEPFETVRRHKSGRLLDVSLSVSPIFGADRRIVGASKIARDISERKRAAEEQTLLLREMNHRVKNLFGVVSGLVAATSRLAEDKDDLATRLREQILALATAHQLTLPDLSGEAAEARDTTLRELISAILAPYSLVCPRVRFTGEDVPVADRMLTSLALLFHEFATNAAKYGSLSVPDGQVAVDLARDGGDVRVTWTEEGGPSVAAPPEHAGFGTQLERLTVERGLRGTIERRWRREGLVIELVFPVL